MRAIKVWTKLLKHDFESLNRQSKKIRRAQISKTQSLRKILRQPWPCRLQDQPILIFAASRLVLCAFHAAAWRLPKPGPLRTQNLWMRSGKDRGRSIMRSLWIKRVSREIIIPYREARLDVTMCVREEICLRLLTVPAYCESWRHT